MFESGGAPPSGISASIIHVSLPARTTQSSSVATKEPREPVNDRLLYSVLTWKDPRSPGIRPRHGAGNGKRFASLRQWRWRTLVTHAVPPAGCKNDAKLSMTQVTVQKGGESERMKPARPVPSWFVELTPRGSIDDIRSRVLVPASFTELALGRSNADIKSRVTSPSPRLPPCCATAFSSSPAPRAAACGCSGPVPPASARNQELDGNFQQRKQEANKTRAGCSCLPSPGGSRVREVSTEVLSRPRPRPRPRPRSRPRPRPRPHPPSPLAFFAGTLIVDDSSPALEPRLRSDISPPLLNGAEPPVEHLARLSRADTSSAQARGFEVAAGR
jgi:hypothetical protein